MCSDAGHGLPAELSSVLLYSLSWRECARSRSTRSPRLVSFAGVFQEGSDIITATLHAVSQTLT